MSAGVVEGTGPFDDEPDDGLGEWLVDHRAEMDHGECGWLLHLARFDRDQKWVVDGQLGVVPWLMFRADLSRSSAYEKIRVARALEAREVVRSAFQERRISFSAVRAITRLSNPTAEMDEVLVKLAEVAPVTDVEMAVRTYEAYANQELPPDERWSRRGFRIGTPVAGLSRVDGALAETEADEVRVALDAFADKLWRDQHRDEEQGSSGGDSNGGGRVCRADAMMALVRMAMAHLDDELGGGEDRLLVHYLHHERTGTVTRLDGSPVAPSFAGAVCCDSGMVDHTVGEQGEPLKLGRKTRQWSTAQRRAIMVRDGGRCRFPGCDNRMTQIHHCTHWSEGGSTDVDNGALLCPRHHAMHHAGFLIEGRPDGTLSFARPDGTPIGVTRPRTTGQLPL